MSIQTILVLALAGALHSVWNLFSKRSLDKQVFLWLAIVASLVIYIVPVAFFIRPFPPHALIFIVLSGVLEGVYYLLLGSAYHRGDLSLVYPLARGSAPLFVTVLAYGLLGERPAPVGIAGILLIVVGIYTLHLKSLAPRGFVAPIMAVTRERASQLALLVGVIIAGYTVVDKVGVSYVNPFPYLYLVLIASSAVLAPYMLMARRAAIRGEWHTNKAAIIAVGFMFVAAYVLVLFALTTSKVSYTSSVREMSVIFAALLGAFVLHEPFGGAKILGAVFIFAGIVCIGLAA